MATTTANLGLTLPTPNVDTGWGSTLNADFQIIDNLFNTAGTGTSVGLNVGTGKTLTLGGTLILGSGTGTASPAAATIRGPTKTGTDAAGVNLTIDAGNGTGLGGSGDIIFRTAPPAGASSNTANTLGAALTIRNSGDQYVVDVGDGGSGATNNISSIRINGSSSGTGIEGGSVLYISNNSVNTGALGNRSTIFAGTTTFSNLTTLWGQSSLSFVVGSGTLAAANEKLRLGSSGQLYVWDTTLGTPALNAGTAGQVLTSNGAAAGLTWETPGINSSPSTAFGTTGCNFEDIPSTTKIIFLSFYGLDTSTSTVLVRLGSGAGPTYKATGYASTGAYTTGASAVVKNTTGFVINSQSASINGCVRLTNVYQNIWVCDYVLSSTTGAGNGYVFTGGGYVDLAAQLTAVQIVGTGIAASGRATILYY